MGCPTWLVIYRTVNRFSPFLVHFPREQWLYRCFSLAFSGNVNHFAANRRHFPETKASETGKPLWWIPRRQAGYLQGVILRITVFLFFMDSNSRAHLPPGRVGVGNVIPRITRAGLPCAGSSPVRTAINIENQCFCII